MKITLLTVGKTASAFVAAGLDEYSERLRHYVPFNIQCVGNSRTTRALPTDRQKVAEGQALLAAIEPADYVALLDEHGTERTSADFAVWLRKRLAGGRKRLVLVVGGPYGFSDDVFQRADEKVALSKMTFPHDLVRLIFAEQLYRAFTILHGEPYHHE